VEEDISEHESVYNDSGEEEIWSDEDKESDAEHTEESLESIASLQRLYAVFLPPHLKQQNPVSICLCPYFSIYLLVNPQAKKQRFLIEVLFIGRTLVWTTGRRGSIGKGHRKAVRNWTCSFR
jgi:hypothetical protein